ncbi:hypothetical protein GCM10023235_58890 [Kitasatospora terrestris]|uniref:Uncharacterized protein n=1 Tax=Kitasatospora terrestris TaxID=258051 RepID=A0ABP9EBV0_9ACTN
MAAWIALWVMSPALPHLLGRPDPTGEWQLGGMLLLASAPAVALGAALGHRRAWTAFVAAVAGALGSCPLVGILIADVEGGGVGAVGAVVVAAFLGLFFGVAPLSVGAVGGSTVRRVRSARSAGVR